MRMRNLATALAAPIIGSGICLGIDLAAVPAEAASISVTTGQAEADSSGYDPATVGSIRLGTEILDLGLAEFDVGVEAATDIEAGETPDGEDWGFQSLGGYLSARTAGPLYLIGRLGIARQEVEIDGDTDDATQQSAGIGIGASIGILQLELIANEYESDGGLDDITWVSAGIRF